MLIEHGLTVPAALHQRRCIHGLLGKAVPHLAAIRRTLGTTNGGWHVTCKGQANPDVQNVESKKEPECVRRVDGG